MRLMGVVLGGVLTGVMVYGPAWAETLPVVEVQRRAIPDMRVYDGVVEPVHQSTVSAQTAGRVAAIHFDVDDYVAKDQVLIRFSDMEQRARVEQAAASLKEAQARAKLSAEEHQRILSLAERKLVSAADRDHAVAELNAAQAAVDVQKARLSEAQQELDYTMVRAPFGGVVVARHVQMGETVQPGQPLMTGLSLDTLRVAAWVPQELVTTVRKSARARVVLAGRELDVPADGFTVFPYADKTTHGFRVWLALPEPQRDVYPGMMVKVAFHVGETQRLLIPRAAVVQRSEVTGVYVQRDDKIVLRHIVTGVVSGDAIEVLAGLDAGERVITDPAAALAQRKPVD